VTVDPTAIAPLAVALEGVAAAAALRSAPALWEAVEIALRQGATWSDLECAVDSAAATAERAVRLEALATLREVAAREGAAERWNR
jgi:hypothetical protein